MTKIRANAAFIHFVNFGLAVSAACTRKKRVDLADLALKTALDVRARGRVWEDRQGETMMATAVKRGADGDLDHCAQDIRFEMAARGRNAVNEAPYTRVWYNGVDHVTGAREADQVARYTELMTLLKENLPESDPILIDELPRMDALLAEWSAALTQCASAETREQQARLSLDEALATFDRALDEIYGTLYKELGRKGADRYFP